MNIYNVIYGPIVFFIGIVLFIKKLDFVKMSVKNKGDSPLLIINENGEEELVIGVKIVFNIIGIAFIIKGLAIVLYEIF